MPEDEFNPQELFVKQILEEAARKPEELLEDTNQALQYVRNEGGVGDAFLKHVRYLPLNKIYECYKASFYHQARKDNDDIPMPATLTQDQDLSRIESDSGFQGSRTSEPGSAVKRMRYMSIDQDEGVEVCFKFLGPDAHLDEELPGCGVFGQGSVSLVDQMTPGIEHKHKIGDQVNIAWQLRDKTSDYQDTQFTVVQGIGSWNFLFGKNARPKKQKERAEKYNEDSESDWNDPKTKSEYFKYRVEAQMTEFEVIAKKQREQKRVQPRDDDFAQEGSGRKRKA